MSEKFNVSDEKIASCISKLGDLNITKQLFKIYVSIYKLFLQTEFFFQTRSIHYTRNLDYLKHPYISKAELI